ncbi:DUF1302 domain-containing protein [Pseudomonas sp. BN414]|uniref:DUF1302 domain-containing protein n=1 Tax=Pseudomonas TaxID=286 RepID=UPI0015BC3E03|nr:MULTISPECIES: DUF1302 domain-containing protein [Pseudomonas]MDH4565609.1 DUF1302 domain-containing protein [Pseudomonas sp. BN414]NWL76034.1 DUF1302 domain-containing protein [Pseudomonas taiwanensis]
MQIIKIKFAMPYDVLYRQSLNSVIAVAALMATGYSLAAPIDVGNPDIKLRWDNTVKYSASMRVKDQSDTLTKNVPPTPGGGKGPAALNGDDGDRNFKRGRLISNRFDLLSEMDLVYREDFGMRVSGAAWYDDVYNRENDNDSPATNNSLSVRNNKFTDDTRELHGRKAEILDAFVFGGTDIGTARVSGRLGQHTVLWGESLFYGANAIAGTQSPVDAIKASSVPGSTTKEIIMPVGQFSGQIQFSPALTLIGFYQYEWDATRLPAAGSYFSVADFLGDGGERIRVAPGVPGNGLARAGDISARDNGQFGLGLRTQLGDWEFGVYGIRYHAKTPVVYSRVPAPTGISGAGLGTYQLVYPEDIKAFGISATTTVGSLNYAGEISVRRDTPLTSLPQNVGRAEADNNNHAFYAIGNSFHANLSMIWSMPRNFLSDEPTLTMEVAYNQMTSCTSNCNAMDPGLDRRAEAVRAVFAAPQRNVMDGLDLTPSFTVGYNHGKSPVVQLGPNNGGDMTFTLAGNYLTVWDFSLAYTHYYGGENTATYASTDPTVNGTFTFAQTLKDRDFVSVSLRRTF